LLKDVKANKRLNNYVNFVALHGHYFLKDVAFFEK
jgi:hypothetical protein